MTYTPLLVAFGPSPACPHAWVTIFNERVKSLPNSTPYPYRLAFARHAKFIVYFYLLIRVLHRILLWPSLRRLYLDHDELAGKLQEARVKLEQLPGEAAEEIESGEARAA